MNIAIVDDEPKIREGLRALVPRLDPGWRVAGAFGDGAEALQFLSHSAVDVLLLDIQMPGLDGFSLLERMVEREMLVIIVSGYAHFEYAQRAISLGVFGYILKPVSPQKLRDALRRAAALIDEKKLESRGLVELREKLVADAVLGSAEIRSLSERAGELGLFEGSYLLACITLENSPTEINNAELRKALARAVHAERGGYAVCIGEGRFVALANAVAEPDFPSRLADRVSSEVARLVPDAPFMVGVSGEFRHLSHASQAWRDALAARVRRTDSVRFAHQDVVDRMSGFSNHVKRAIRHIITHADQPLRLEDIGDAVFLHANYISDLFRRETGVPLSGFIIEYKIYRAKKLLRDPSIKIYGVAEAVGFRDQRYFSQVFKKHVGMSPMEYRQFEK